MIDNERNNKGRYFSLQHLITSFVKEVHSQIDQFIIVHLFCDKYYNTLQ